MAGCPVCSGPLVNDRERGEVVCVQCGLVVAESTVDVGPGWRVFDEREKRRVRTAPLKLVIKTDLWVKLGTAYSGASWRGSTETPYTATRGGLLKSERSSNVLGSASACLNAWLRRLNPW